MTSLFSPKLIPQLAKGAMYRGHEVRPLRSDDYDKGVLKVLETLTTVGEVTEEQFKTQFEAWKKSGDYFVAVIEGPGHRVLAVGTIFIERKLIHSVGKVGHIEDIAVSKNQQGKKFGQRIIETLSAIGKGQGCYKIILDCDEKNVKFYEKCGYSRHGVEMNLRFDGPKQKL